MQGTSQIETPIRTDRIVIQNDRIVFEVHIPEVRFRTTNEKLIRLVEERFPYLSRHACVNDAGNTFGAVMEHTSIPHLLEHILIDLQTQRVVPVQQTERKNRPDCLPDCQGATSPSAEDFLFVGTTEWIDEQRGKARIEVNFTDDLIALRCFSDALELLNNLLVVA